MFVQHHASYVTMQPNHMAAIEGITRQLRVTSNGSYAFHDMAAMHDTTWQLCMSSHGSYACHHMATARVIT